MWGVGTLATDRKKKIERLYVEGARRASSLFPTGEFLSHERPDFLLSLGTGKLGIEVTELCREKPRQEAATLARIPTRAKAIYTGLVGSSPIDVSLAFSQRATNLHHNQLVNSLAAFVYAHRTTRGPCAANNLPDGYCHIGIFEPRQEIDPTGRWHGVRAFDVEFASEQLVECCIAKKNGLLAEYRRSATEVWLLIVNDQFLGPGEVYVHPDHLAKWKFSFDFEKVLLFAHEIGGVGKLFELQRI